jgi:hypothetical protein
MAPADAVVGAAALGSADVLNAAGNLGTGAAFREPSRAPSAAGLARALAA